jgi:hypothetical protein
LGQGMCAHFAHEPKQPEAQAQGISRAEPLASLVSGSSKSLKVSNIDQRVSTRNVRLHYHGIYR